MGRPQKIASGIPRILNADLVAEHADLGDASQYTLCSFNVLGASPYPQHIIPILGIPYKRDSPAVHAPDMCSLEGTFPNAQPQS